MSEDRENDPNTENSELNSEESIKKQEGAELSSDELEENQNDLNQEKSELIAEKSIKKQEKAELSSEELEESEPDLEDIDQTTERLLETTEESSNLLPVKNTPSEYLGMVGVYNKPIFPNMAVPLIIEGRKLVRSVQDALKKKNGFLSIFLIKENFDANNPEETAFEKFGVVGKIIKTYVGENKSIQILVEIIGRVQRKELISEKPFLLIRVKHFPEPKIKVDNEIRAYCREILSNMKELIKINQLVKEEVLPFIANVNIDDPGRLADFAATLTTADKSELQDILENLDIHKRLKKTLYLIKRELDLGRLQAKISKQIEDRITKTQREFFLREQLKEIRKELGLTHDEKDRESEKLKKRMSKLKLSPQVKEVFDEELNKLQHLDPQSAEYNVSRTYLDWLTCLPWGIYQKENSDLQKARVILERDHYGMDDVKERIIEFIATMILKKERTGAILCLVGPPGVGKTSVGRSIAKALNRPFYRFSLGGMRDEAEIKGHRRTYIGAMPGKFIQALKVTQKSNPVIMLDEIDKVGANYQGDPSGALLEVLDPEQNVSFMDHYLDVPFDLSKVMFIMTANQLDTISKPLLDRMEVIELSGYITEEKVQITKKYLVPKQRKSHGLTGKNFQISDDAIRRVVEQYARESGVRNLEKQIKKICRKIAVKIVSSDENKAFRITLDSLKNYLKNPIFTDSELHGAGVPGCVNGLAWTSLGGAILTVEALKMLSESKGFKQSGQLGKVMIESSELAYSYILANAESFGGNAEYFRKYFIHLHVPAGATPKDGPSAGVTMATALISLMLDKPVKEYLGMTGELTLTGEVLAIGGLREKILASKRAGLKEIIVPDTNKKDWEELPEQLKESLQVHFAGDFQKVFEVAFSD